MDIKQYSSVCHPTSVFLSFGHKNTASIKERFFIKTKKIIHLSLSLNDSKKVVS